MRVELQFSKLIAFKKKNVSKRKSTIDHLAKAVEKPDNELKEFYCNSFIIIFFLTLERNTIRLSCQEQVCLMRQRFKRYFFHH